MAKLLILAVLALVAVQAQAWTVGRATFYGKDGW